MFGRATIRLGIGSHSSWLGFNVPLNTLTYRSYRGRVLRVKWPNQQCQSTEGSNGPKDQASIPPGPPHRMLHACNIQSDKKLIHTQMNLSTVKWAQWDKTQSRELLVLFICVCSSLCTIVAHNIAQNRPDNFPSCPPVNHHCSDDVYLRRPSRWELANRESPWHRLATKLEKKFPEFSRLF